MTTLAWRLAHIADFLWAERCATWLGLRPVLRSAPFLTPASAGEALAVVRRARELGRMITTREQAATVASEQNPGSDVS